MATLEEVKAALIDYVAKAPENFKEIQYKDEAMEAETTAHHADLDFDGVHYVVNVWKDGITISSGSDILLDEKADVGDLRTAVESVKVDTKGTALETLVTKLKAATTDVKPVEAPVEEEVLP